MKESVVFVHGLWMTGLDMTLLRWRVGRCGYRTHQFFYHSLRHDLAANAARLNRYLQRVPGETVHLVGHSLGGLVIRRLLLDYPRQRPGRVVTLGTPHAASAVACRLCSGRVGRILLGRSADALSARLPAWDGRRELGSIAGNLPMGAGRLFVALSGAHDGTVAVEETRLDGADHIVLPVSHMGLVTAASVVEQTCHFLRHGRFLRSP